MHWDKGVHTEDASQTKYVIQQKFEEHLQEQLMSNKPGTRIHRPVGLAFLTKIYVYLLQWDSLKRRNKRVGFKCILVNL